VIVKQPVTPTCDPRAGVGSGNDQRIKPRIKNMKTRKLRNYGLSLLMAGAALLSVTSSVQAADKKPNILVIWGDDIGQFNISAYNMGCRPGVRGIDEDSDRPGGRAMHFQ
jgi:hypothetical protein